MAINKVEANGETLIDLTSDTVTADTLVSGRTAHLASGVPVTGTFEPVTGVKGNAESAYRKGNVNLTPANIGAATSEQGAKADSAVQTIQIGGTAQAKTNGTVNLPAYPTKSSLGLGNVGNFKAVSTVSSQGLTDTEKANARTNIGAGTSSFDGNYNSLSNKPTIPTAVAVKGNAETSYRTGNVNLTPANLGLGNVNNTSDANKPISTATQAALDAQQAQIDDNSEISETSDTTSYLYKASEHDAVYDELVGGSVAWNQLIPTTGTSGESSGVTFTNNGDGSWTLNGTSSGTIIARNRNLNYTANKKNYINNHKYFMYADCDDSNVGIAIVRDVGSAHYAYGKTATIINYAEGSETASWARIQLFTSGYKVTNVVTKPQVFDLTQMFGSMIADYAYSLEQSTAGSGIAWLKSYGFFTEDYYPYNAGTLTSVNVSGKKIVGKNLLDASQIVVGSIGGQGQDISSDTRLRTAYIPVLPNTTYTAISGNNVQVYEYHEYRTDKSHIKFVPINATSGSNTMSPDTHFIRLLFRYSDNRIMEVSDMPNPQLELGSRATDYEPYTSITYPIQSIDLRGLYKLNGNKLYTDGDIYSSDGTVTRKYGYRDYQSGDESLANAITDGTHTIYKLSAPTTETASSYTSPQMVYRNGTEEYLDTRDVPLPVGGNRKYMDIPDWMVNEYFDDVREMLDKQQAQIDIALEQSGYNLLEITAGTQTVNGVTFTVDKVAGTITANGTATALTAISLSDQLSEILKVGNSYYMTGCPVGGAYYSTYALYVALDGATVWRDDGSGEQYSVPQSGTLSALYVLIRSGVTVSNLVFRPMIVPTELAGMPFQPYSLNNVELTQKALIKEDDNTGGYVVDFDKDCKLQRNANYINLRNNSINLHADSSNISLQCGTTGSPLRGVTITDTAVRMYFGLNTLTVDEDGLWFNDTKIAE